MTTLPEAVDQLLNALRTPAKPLAAVLAGHNGSGKSTLWYDRLAPLLQIPLINADRMVMSILPDPPLPEWANHLRSYDPAWMSVAQRGVTSFVAEAMASAVPFAMETVFSHWRPRPDGSSESKIDLIRDLQAAGYFVALFFVGLASHDLSIGRVRTRVASGGHDVPNRKLIERFPRTQRAIRLAIDVAELLFSRTTAAARKTRSRSASCVSAAAKCTTSATSPIRFQHRSWHG